MTRRLHAGVAAALASAMLFGVGTPLAKPLLAHANPVLVAALFYLGSGAGLWILRRTRNAPAVRLEPGEWRWLAGAIVAGGVVGPALLMLGLSAMPASSASLLLNAEGALTALVAWFVFRENFDARIALGMLAIVAGGVVLAWPDELRAAAAWPALAVVGACLAWAIDNNLTRKVSLSDASFIAMSKGLVAGSTNLALAIGIGAEWPGVGVVAGAALIGFASYGLSLVLFVVALRHLGTARTGAYFSVAPFFGAATAIALLGEPVTAPLVVAGLLMGIGVWLHLTERHEHIHAHDRLEHSHAHAHAADGDLHHEHDHDAPVPPGTRHAHWHVHLPLSHAHPHYPDAHHRHRH